MSVKSAERVIKILELLSRFPDGMTVKEISNALSYPQSSTFNLVQTMAHHQFLVQNASKKYKLGPKLIQIGTRARESLDVHTEAHPYLVQLMNRVEETVFMAVLSGDEMVYVAKIDNNRSIRTSAQIGSSKPLYCTGLGKAFLSFLPVEERERLLAKTQWFPVTRRTITDADELRKQLLEFRRLGYAIDDEESEEGLFCLAAPVFDANRRLIAAISVAGPRERMHKRKDEIIRCLMETAAHISERMGNIPLSLHPAEP
jgi:DNA-binding IclR family transcriptional regulator